MGWMNQIAVWSSFSQSPEKESKIWEKNNLYLREVGNKFFYSYWQIE